MGWPAGTRLVTNGLRSIAVGIGLFLAFGLFFEGLIGLSGRPFLTTDAGPYVLIAAGSWSSRWAWSAGRRAGPDQAGRRRLTWVPTNRSGLRAAPDGSQASSAIR